MAKTVLLSAPYMLPSIDRFRPAFERYGLEIILPEVNERLEADEIMPYAGDFDAAICGDDRFNADVLEACAPRLKVISKWGTGIDSIDQEAAKRLGVQVRNTLGAFTEPVADSVMAYILAFARQSPWLDDRVKAGDWEKLPGHSLNELSLGIVGLGRIGKAVALRANAFGMRLLGTDIIEMPAEFVVDSGIEMLSLEELLSQADFVSLNCDLNPSSRHLINAKTLALIKPNAVLINTARGPLVDENALIEALQADAIAGAALDVFKQEPLPTDSPLRKMDNVMLAPHNANASPAAWERVHWNTIRNLLDGLGIPTEDLKPEDYPA
jgi:D-3-phosphoglycerate dehydrogenase